MFGLLGACTSTGIVPSDMKLAVSNVTVTQSGDVSEGSRFSHEMREEIRYEFSRAERGEKEVKLFLEVRELAFLDSEKNLYQQGSNMMATYGRLVDAYTGDAIGEFPLTVKSENGGIDTSSPMGRDYIKSDLIRLTARATLDKIYGKRRAAKIAERLPRHARAPYLVKVSKPIQLVSVNANYPVVVPQPIDIEVVGADGVEIKKPVVIDAPQLPVQ